LPNTGRNCRVAIQISIAIVKRSWSVGCKHLPDFCPLLLGLSVDLLVLIFGYHDCERVVSLVEGVLQRDLHFGPAESRRVKKLKQPGSALPSVGAGLDTGRTLGKPFGNFHRVNVTSLIPAIAAASSSDKPNASDAAILATTTSVCFVGQPSLKRPRRERLPVGRVAAAGTVLEYPLSRPSFAIKTRCCGKGLRLIRQSIRHLRFGQEGFHPVSKFVPRPANRERNPA
jgi:hypothetical protein